MMDELSYQPESAKAVVAMAINQDDLMGQYMNSTSKVTFHVNSFTLSLSRAK